MRTGPVYGWLYLIHIDRPVGSGAQHYLGWSADPDRRLNEDHRKGRGARLLRVAVRAGVVFDIARRWPNKTRADESAMKRRGHLPQHCPQCREAWRKRRNAHQAARRLKDGRADRPLKAPRGPKA